MNVLEGHNWTLYVGDCREAMAVMPERSVHCVVSSPPYWGLRDYGIPPVDWQDGERCVFGLESTVQGYVRHTLEVFEGLRRVLRDDGVIWWNVGDSFITGAGKAKNPGSRVGNGNRMSIEDYPATGPNRMPQDGIPAGSKGLIPHRIAIALQEAGWCVRQDNVWAKRSPMPESVSGWRWRDGKLRKGSWRTTNAHEYIFMVTKGGNYFSDGDGAAEAVANVNRSGSGNKTKRWGNNHTDVRANGTGEVERQSGTPWSNCETRNPRSVWTLSNEPFKGAHFACFPTAIPRRCITASTSRGGVCPACGSQYAPIVETSRVATRPGNDSKVGRVSDKPESPYHGQNGAVVGNRDPQRHVTVVTVHGYRASCDCNAGEPVRPRVFDPFNGSGTTGQVAVSLGCEYVGCEINETYARELAAVRIETPLPDRTKPAPKRRKRHKEQRSLFSEGGH